MNGKYENSEYNRICKLGVNDFVLLYADNSIMLVAVNQNEPSKFVVLYTLDCNEKYIQPDIQHKPILFDYDNDYDVVTDKVKYNDEYFSVDDFILMEHKKILAFLYTKILSYLSCNYDRVNKNSDNYKYGLGLELCFRRCVADCIVCAVKTDIYNYIKNTVDEYVEAEKKLNNVQ